METTQGGVGPSAYDASVPTLESRMLKSVLGAVSAIYVHCEVRF